MTATTAHICLFGASPGTGNQGVNALCWSALEGIAARTPAQLRVFRYGEAGVDHVVPGSRPPVRFHAESMSAGRRFWRNDHLARATLAGRSKSSRNAIVNTIRHAGAVLDASGGDSFTDLYGAQRFRSVIAPKRLALSLGRPLMLLPQTYGPFQSARNERLARDTVDRATLAYARDPDSYEKLQRLLGDRFDPKRHRSGVDLAFALRSSQPGSLEPAVQRALSLGERHGLIALNISGLLSHQAAAAKTRFGLHADYPALTAGIVTALLESSDAHILLLPHVHAPSGHFESDLDACLGLVERLPRHARAAADDRLAILTQPLDATELKWIIGRADWLCGTRMHSTIAALSQGVPACALAYSLKARGVFETCGAGDAVVDLRHEDTRSAQERVLWAWRNRAALAENMAEHLPGVMSSSRRQLDEIVDSLSPRKAA